MWLVMEGLRGTKEVGTSVRRGRGRGRDSDSDGRTRLALMVQETDQQQDAAKVGALCGRSFHDSTGYMTAMGATEVRGNTHTLLRLWE